MIMAAQADDSAVTVEDPQARGGARLKPDTDTARPLTVLSCSSLTAPTSTQHIRVLQENGLFRLVA